MNFKRIVVFIVALLFCVGLFLTGCSKNTESTQDTVTQPDTNESTASNEKQQSEGREMIGNMYKEGLPIVKEKITLKATVQKDALHGDWNEMDVWKMLEQKTNIHIEWEQVPRDSFEEKKNLMFASGDLPDLFLSGLSRLDEVKYGKEGYLIPLEDLIEKWAPNVKKLFSKRPESKKLCTAPDGHIYALLGLEELVNRYNPDNMFINKKWLDKLGLEIPKTTEEFYKVLKAFKEKDPNGNGKQDEIPLSFVYGKRLALAPYSLFGSFGVLDNPDHVMIKNGKIIFTPMEEGYKEAVKYFARLYQEGLIDPEVFTQDKKQYFAKGKAEPEIMGSGLVWFDENLFGSERAKNDYVVLPPLEGPNGDKMWNKYLLVYSTGRGAITSNNKYPEITMRWINELFDEDMSFQLFYGPFGKLWEKKENGKIVPLPTPEGMSRDEYRYKTCPAYAMPAAVYSETFEKVELTEDNTRKNERYNIYAPFMPEEVLPPLYYTVEQTEELSTLKTDINTYVERMFAKWVSGESDVEKDWDKYIQDLKKMKVDRLIQIYQEAYDFYKSVK